MRNHSLVKSTKIFHKKLFVCAAWIVLYPTFTQKIGFAYSAPLPINLDMYPLSGKSKLLLNRIDSYDSENVTFHYNHHEDNVFVRKTVPALDFISLLTQHIPGLHYKMTRSVVLTTNAQCHWRIFITITGVFLWKNFTKKQKPSVVPLDLFSRLLHTVFIRRQGGIRHGL